MDRILINKLLDDIPNLKVHRIKEGIIPSGLWFGLEVKPLPSYEDLKMVAYDVAKDNILHITGNLALSHSELCTEKHHDLDDLLERALEETSDHTYMLAIWEGNDQVLNGQPVVISLDPEISFNIYPDHPHINAGGLFKSENKYIPSSICYTDDPNALGDNQYTRILEAIHQTIIWLFKHQIWVSTKKIGKGIWIGPQVYNNENQQFSYYRDPYGKCRCGSNKQYYKCHLNEDFRNLCLNESILLRPENRCSTIFKKANGTVDVEKYRSYWEKKINDPQNKVLSLLKKEIQYI